ncbi:putative reverse transcriptase domain-containing protein [Tanacetum coccineum]
MECRVRRLRRNTFISYAVTGSIPINRGLIQAIPISLPPQPIGEATKASNLQRIPPGVQWRSHFTYFLYLIVQIRILVNIPFIETLEQMPKYAKFMKDLLAQRGRGNEASKITLNERCSSVVLNKIPLKEKVHPYAILSVLKIKPWRIKTYVFFFPVNFVVLDMKEDHKIPIILGRPFLATAYAMIDVFNKKISFEVGDETITFDIEKSMRFPHSDDDTYHSVDMIDLSILDHVQEILPSEPFDSFLFGPINHHLPTKINSLWDDNEGEQDLINQISRNLEPESEGYTKPTLFTVNMFEGEKPITKLKDLPSHLEYAFLGNNQEFPVIISSLLSTQEKELLLGVLAKHKSALAWKVADIKD